MTAALATYSLAPAHSAEHIRLALFTDTFVPQVNGVARTLDRLTRVIRERGGSVRTYTTSDPNAMPDFDVIRYESVPFWAYPHLRISLPRSQAVLRDLEEYAPTLVHAATPFGLGLVGRRVANQLGVPFITSYHTSFSAYAKYYRLGAMSEVGWSFLRRFHNSGARTFVPSHAVRDELVARGFTNVRVWDRGVDTGLFHPTFRNDALRTALGARNDTILIGYVGRIAREKGIDTILDAIPHVLTRTAYPVQFVFVGEGPYEGACRKRALPNTTFLGRHDGRTLSELYASLDAFVFPSTTDTFGNVLLEAAASRVATIGADVSTTREVMGDAAMYVPPHDAMAMADTLLRIIGDTAVRDRLGNAALAHARTRSWTAVFDTLISEYRAVSPSKPVAMGEQPRVALAR